MLTHCSKFYFREHHIIKLDKKGRAKEKINDADPNQEQACIQLPYTEKASIKSPLHTHGPEIIFQFKASVLNYFRLIIHKWLNPRLSNIIQK